VKAFGLNFRVRVLRNLDWRLKIKKIFIKQEKS